MKKYGIIDYWSCILFRLLGPVIRFLPKSWSMFLGRRMGDLFYYFDPRHKAIAYANIKTACKDSLSPAQLSRLTQEFYRTFGQNLIEIFLIPVINAAYISRYVDIEGLDYIKEAFQRGKGVILLGVHEGSWELANIICANMGFPFVVLVRDQRYPRLSRLLNFYRSQRGCRIIQRENEVRQLIQALKENQAVGMTLDQGGKSGALVKFFGKEASMASGAIKLALKYDVTIIPSFFVRIKGSRIKIILEPPFKIEKTVDPGQDMQDNLQRLTSIFEKQLLKYPKEYLWTYKIWKYTTEKHTLILSDAKAGHLRQSQAAARVLSDYLKDQGMTNKVDTVQVKFKSSVARGLLALGCGLAGKYCCQGCLFCLRKFLEKDSYFLLLREKPNFIISCGSALAPVNFVLSRENAAKSIVIMRPSFLSTRRFDLVIMPRHDRPPNRKNVVATEGALNLIDDTFLKTQAETLKSQVGINKELVVGLLLGGNSKGFRLTADGVKKIIGQIKAFLEKEDGQVLVTTSRRTPPEIERLLKEEFGNYSRTALLIIANEKNIPEAVGGILGLSGIIVSSPESISMISEAASSGKYVLVFNVPGLSGKHRRFLRDSAQNKYIYLCRAWRLCSTLTDVWSRKPAPARLRDSFLVKEALEKIV